MWNVHTLRGAGKLELLANEMKWYNLSIVAVTETHSLVREKCHLMKKEDTLCCSLEDRMV